LNFFFSRYNNESMINIDGEKIWRGGEKIGWIDEGKIYSLNSGEKVGYCSGNAIYRVDGTKIGWLDGDFIKTVDGESIRIEENREHVVGSDESDVVRAAIRLLLGD